MNSQHSRAPMLHKWTINKSPCSVDSETRFITVRVSSGQPSNPEIYCYMSKSDHKIPSQHSSHAHKTPCNTIFTHLPLLEWAYLLRFVCSHIIDAGLFHFVIISATISRQPSSLLGKAIKCASHLKAPLHKRVSLSPNSSTLFW